MNAALNPYPEYRDSGVDWLPQVPAHWEIVRSKRVFREIDDRGSDGTELHLAMSQKFGLVPSADLATKHLRSASYAAAKRCLPGDVVLNRLKAHLGVFARANHRGVVSPDYTVLRSDGEVEPRYFEYTYRSTAFRGELRKSVKGIVEGFWRLYSADLGRLMVPAPPPEEQRRIADFLDAYTAQVHRLIAAKRRTIAALIERRRSIITNRLYAFADSGGAPTPFKPDWPLRAIKRVANVSFSSVDKHIYRHERQVRVCNYVDVYKNDRVGLAAPFREGSVTEAEYASYALKAGDVLVTKDSEDWKDICVPCLVTDDIPDTVCGYHLAILRPNTEKISGEYLYFALLAAPTTWQFHKAATGITRYGIGKNEIGTVVIPLPSSIEQNEICRALAQELGSVDAAKDKVGREIDLILEYRDSLIAAVVTGQLDVREAAVRIVEGDELADDTATDEEDMEDALDAVD